MCTTIDGPAHHPRQGHGFGVDHPKYCLDRPLPKLYFNMPGKCKKGYSRPSVSVILQVSAALHLGTYSAPCGRLLVPSPGPLRGEHPSEQRLAQSFKEYICT